MAVLVDPNSSIPCDTTSVAARPGESAPRNPQNRSFQSSDFPPLIAYMTDAWSRGDERKLSSIRERNSKKVVEHADFATFCQLCEHLQVSPCAALEDIFSRCAIALFDLVPEPAKGSGLCIAISYHGRRNRSQLGGRLPEKGAGFLIVAAFALTLAESLRHHGCFVVLGGDFNMPLSELQRAIPMADEVPEPPMAGPSNLPAASPTAKFRELFDNRIHPSRDFVWVQGERVARPSANGRGRKRKLDEGGTAEDIDGIVVFAPASSTEIERIVRLQQDDKGTNVPGKVHPMVGGHFRIDLKPLVKQEQMELG